MYRNWGLNQWNSKGQPLSQRHHRGPWQHAHQHPGERQRLLTFLMGSQQLQSCVLRRALQGGNVCYMEWSDAGSNQTLQTRPSSDVARGTSLSVSEEGAAGVTQVTFWNFSKPANSREAPRAKYLSTRKKGEDSGRKEEKAHNRQITVWVSMLYFSQFSFIWTQECVTSVIKKTHTHTSHSS